MSRRPPRRSRHSGLTWMVLAVLALPALPLGLGHGGALVPHAVSARGGPSGARPLSSAVSPRANPGLGWANVGAPAPPPGLFYPSLASDPVDGYVLLFGGCTAVICSSPSNATWEYSLGHWTELSPIRFPPARTEAVMVWDPADHYVLLYGGQGAHGVALTDTWAFQNGEWSPITTHLNPGGREDASMAFDLLDDYAVLFGGSACNATCGTWSYRGGTWTSLNTSGLPPARYGAAIAFDVSLGKVLLFGGTSSGGAILGDTWEYASGTWYPLGSGPPQRSDASMAYNSVLGAVVLFGGEYITLSNFPGVTYNDTWEFGTTGWIQLTPSTGAPAEYEGALALDPEDGSDLLFGGCGPSECPGATTWVFGVETSVSITTVPASCGTVDIAGLSERNGAMLSLPVGTYALSGSACAHYALAAVNGSGGVVTDYAGDAANVSSEGILAATFTPFTYRVVVEVSPASCGEIQFGNLSVASGGGATVAYGSYDAVAPACSGEVFSAWLPSNHNLTITAVGAANTTIAVAGNATLTATFTPAPVSSSVPGGTLLGLPTLVWLAVVVAVAIVAIALVIGRSRRRPRPPAAAARQRPSPTPPA